MTLAKTKCALIVLFLSLLAQPGCEPAAADSGWIVLQHNREFGDMRIHITEHAIKWENGDTGILMIAREPDWKLTGYNRSSRKYYEFSPSEVAQFMLGSETKFHRGYAPAKLEGSANGLVRGLQGKIAGHKCVQYIYPKRLNTQFDQAKAKFYRDSSADKSSYGALSGQRKEIWYATDIFFPKTISKYLSGDTRTDLNFPLREIRYRTAGQALQRFVDLDTSEVQRIRYKTSDFNEPKGFGKAGSQMALLINESTADDLLGAPDAGKDKKAAPAKGK